jgi:hypothetical protein
MLKTALTVLAIVIVIAILGLVGIYYGLAAGYTITITAPTGTTLIDYETEAAPAIAQAAAPVTLTGIVEVDPCVTGAQPELQIEPLVENHKVVREAFVGLPLNRDEVGRGVRYRIPIQAGAYVHLFVAINDGDHNGDGLTHEIHGGNGAVAINTAFTIWCKAGNWNGALAGQARVMNAMNLPTPLSDEWMTIPASGIMPVPPALVGAYTPAQTPANTNEVTVTNPTPAPTTPKAGTNTAPNNPCSTLGSTDWFAVGDNQCHIGPLPAAYPLWDFTVPEWAAETHWFYAISADESASGKAKPGETISRLHEATLFYAPR